MSLGRAGKLEAAAAFDADRAVAERLAREGFGAGDRGGGADRYEGRVAAVIAEHGQIQPVPDPAWIGARAETQHADREVQTSGRGRKDERPHMQPVLKTGSVSVPSAVAEFGPTTAELPPIAAVAAEPRAGALSCGR